MLKDYISYQYLKFRKSNAQYLSKTDNNNSLADIAFSGHCLFEQRKSNQHRLTGASSCHMRPIHIDSLFPSLKPYCDLSEKYSSE